MWAFDPALACSCEVTSKQRVSINNKHREVIAHAKIDSSRSPLTCSGELNRAAKHLRSPASFDGLRMGDPVQIEMKIKMGSVLVV
jgi:hypothetical protein